MTVIQNAALPRSGLPGIDHVTLAGGEHGLEALSVWKQSIAAGSATPPHRHDCEEVVLVTAGRGELQIDGAVQKFGADTTLVIPRNVLHQIVNTGDTPLEIVAAFSVSPVEAFFPDGERIELPWAS